MYVDPKHKKNRDLMTIILKEVTTLPHDSCEQIIKIGNTV